MRLVLDTCALIALAEGERMREVALDAVRRAQSARMAYVPSVVALEIAQKSTAGKLRFADGLGAREWFERVMALFHLRPLPVTANVALAACELPEPFHKDPADRLIVALARLLDAPLVTIDQRILAYGRSAHVRAIAY